MDQHFAEFSKSLAESVPRPESPQGATAPIHRAICSLAYLVAASGILGVAQAGNITFDFVNPITGTNGYDVRGSITVDSTGISAAPVDLTSSMVQSWHISVFDSSNVLQFSLASTSDIFDIFPTDAFDFAPRISTSSLFLPTVPFPTRPILDYLSNFELKSSTLPPNAVFWRVDSSNGFGPNTYDRVSLAQSTPPTTVLFFTFDNSQSDFLIAVAEPASVVPEPASIILWGIGGLFLTIGSPRQRRPLGIQARAM